MTPPDNIAQGFVEGDYPPMMEGPPDAGCLAGRAWGTCCPEPGRWFDVTSNPADFGATHALKYDDGTVELLAIAGDAVLVRLP